MPAHGFLQPAYHHLGREELANRAAQACPSLADCRACPRDCRVNRLEDRDISQDVKPAAQRGSDSREIAAMMLWLQGQGCHNINFVTPEHVAPQVVESVAEAVPLGLNLPIVYNTSAYDSLDSIALLDGLVDI